MRARNIGILASLALAGVLVGCGDRDADPAVTGGAQRISTEPTTAKVERRDIVGYALVGGDLFTPPTEQAMAYAPYQGTVERVLTSVGQRVGKGEVLVDLQAPENEAYYEQARMTLQQARNAFESAEAQFEVPVRDAERRLAQARSTERTIRSQTTPGGDATALQQATNDRMQAENAVRQARAQMQIDMQPYEAQLQQAREAFRAAEQGLKQTQVKAPITGTVVELNATAGQTLGVGPVAKVVDLDDLKVKARYAAELSDRIKPKKSVVVIFNEFPQQHFHGTVASVQPLPADSSGRVFYEATIEFDNEKGLIKPGMDVRSVGVETGKANDAIAVLVDAVGRDDTGRPFVSKMVNGQWTPVIVDIGLTDGTYVAVKPQTGSLEQGDTVQVIPGRGAESVPAAAVQA